MTDKFEATPDYTETTEIVDTASPLHRRLRALAGPDKGYLFITVDDAGEATLDFGGIDPDNIGPGLRELAGRIEAAA